MKHHNASKLPVRNRCITPTLANQRCIEFLEVVWKRLDGHRTDGKFNHHQTGAVKPWIQETVRLLESWNPALRMRPAESTVEQFNGRSWLRCLLGKIQNATKCPIFSVSHFRTLMEWHEGAPFMHQEIWQAVVEVKNDWAMLDYAILLPPQRNASSTSNQELSVSNGRRHHAQSQCHPQSSRIQSTASNQIASHSHISNARQQHPPPRRHSHSLQIHSSVSKHTRSESAVSTTSHDIYRSSQNDLPAYGQPFQSAQHVFDDFGPVPKQNHWRRQQQVLQDQLGRLNVHQQLCGIRSRRWSPKHRSIATQSAIHSQFKKLVADESAFVDDGKKPTSKEEWKCKQLFYGYILHRDMTVSDWGTVQELLSIGNVSIGCVLVLMRIMIMRIPFVSIRSYYYHTAELALIWERSDSLYLSRFSPEALRRRNELYQQFTLSVPSRITREIVAIDKAADPAKAIDSLMNGRESNPHHLSSKDAFTANEREQYPSPHSHYDPRHHYDEVHRKVICDLCRSRNHGSMHSMIVPSDGSSQNLLCPPCALGRHLGLHRAHALRDEDIQRGLLNGGIKIAALWRKDGELEWIFEFRMKSCPNPVWVQDECIGSKFFAVSDDRLQRIHPQYEMLHDAIANTPGGVQWCPKKDRVVRPMAELLCRFLEKAEDLVARGQISEVDPFYKEIIPLVLKQCQSAKQDPFQFEVDYTGYGLSALNAYAAAPGAMRFILNALPELLKMVQDAPQQFDAMLDDVESNPPILAEHCNAFHYHASGRSPFESASESTATIVSLNYSYKSTLTCFHSVAWMRQHFGDNRQGFQQWVRERADMLKPVLKLNALGKMRTNQMIDEIAQGFWDLRFDASKKRGHKHQMVKTRVDRNDSQSSKTHLVKSQFAVVSNNFAPTMKQQWPQLAMTEEKLCKLQGMIVWMIGQAVPEFMHLSHAVELQGMNGQGSKNKDFIKYKVNHIVTDHVDDCRLTDKDTAFKHQYIGVLKLGPPDMKRHVLCNVSLQQNCKYQIHLFGHYELGYLDFYIMTGHGMYGGASHAIHCPKRYHSTALEQFRFKDTSYTIVWRHKAS